MTTLSKRARKKKRGALYSNMTIVGLLLLVGILSYQIVQVRPKFFVSENRLEAVQATLLLAEAERDTLRGEVDFLNTQAGQERAIRDRFNVVREGEGVVYIIEEESEIQTVSAEEVVVQEEGFFARVKRFLGFK